MSTRQYRDDERALTLRRNGERRLTYRALGVDPYVARGQVAAVRVCIFPSLAVNAVCHGYTYGKMLGNLTDCKEARLRQLPS